MLFICQALCHLNNGDIELKKWQLKPFVTKFLVGYVSLVIGEMSY